MQVPVIIKVPMARFQGVAYNWIKATGTLRLDPDSLLNANTFRTYAPLNNKVMELRKVCPFLPRSMYDYMTGMCALAPLQTSDGPALTLVWGLNRPLHSPVS